MTDEEVVVLVSETERARLNALKDVVWMDFSPIINDMDKYVEQRRQVDPETPIAIGISSEGECFAEGLKCSYKLSYIVEEFEE